MLFVRVYSSLLSSTGYSLPTVENISERIYQSSLKYGILEISKQETQEKTLRTPPRIIILYPIAYRGVSKRVDNLLGFMKE